LECILDQVDPQFDATQANKYRLSVLLCQDGFSFLVTHSISLKVLKLSCFKLKQADIHHDEKGDWPTTGIDYFEQLRKVDCTQMSWQQVEIAVASNKITVAPHNFLTQGNELKIISAVHTVSTEEEIITEPIFDLGPVTAAVVPCYIMELCKTIFPGSFIRNESAIFVKGVLRKHSQIITRQAFINIHHDFIEIAVIQGLRLLYLNAFKYSAPSDVLYYVIFVLEQLGFVPSEENVILMGEIADTSSIYSELKMYCGSLNFISKPVELEYGPAFAGITFHNFFTLLNMPICE